MNQRLKGTPFEEGFDDEDVELVIEGHYDGCSGMQQCCHIDAAAVALLEELRETRRRAGEICTICWHNKDTHGDNPQSCYACHMMKLPADRADHAFV